MQQGKSRAVTHLDPSIKACVKPVHVHCHVWLHLLCRSHAATDPTSRHPETGSAVSLAFRLTRFEVLALVCHCDVRFQLRERFDVHCHVVSLTVIDQLGQPIQIILEEPSCRCTIRQSSKAALKLPQSTSGNGVTPSYDRSINFVSW
jgi:hypothetical protein